MCLYANIEYNVFKFLEKSNLRTKDKPPLQRQNFGMYPSTLDVFCHL